MEQTNNSSTITLEKKRSLSPETAEEVRVLGIAEYEQAAQCLAEAFAVDEVARYFIDTDDMAAYSKDYKYKLHCDILRYITAAHCYKGIVTTIGPDYDAVALWYVPSFYIRRVSKGRGVDRDIGCHLERTWMISGPSSALACGASGTSSLAKVKPVSITSSYPCSTIPSTTLWGLVTMTPITLFILEASRVLVGKATRRN
jgi:hypothetical protein